MPRRRRAVRLRPLSVHPGDREGGRHGQPRRRPRHRRRQKRHAAASARGVGPRRRHANSEPRAGSRGAGQLRASQRARSQGARDAAPLRGRLHRGAAARGLARRVDLRPHPDPAHERRQRGPRARCAPDPRRPRRSTSPHPTRPRSPTRTRTSDHHDHRRARFPGQWSGGGDARAARRPSAADDHARRDADPPNPADRHRADRSAKCAADAAEPRPGHRAATRRSAPPRRRSSSPSRDGRRDGRVRHSRRLPSQPQPRLGHYPTYMAKLGLGPAVSRSVPPGTRVLDAGCGEGVLVESYATRIAGVDDNYSSAHVIRGSLMALPYGAATFDRVLCLDVLEHVLRRSAAPAPSRSSAACSRRMARCSSRSRTSRTCSRD